ncbi:hypothetical protein COLO4_21278 [Corchorus olitorius]|uniref:Uncharacterized protein n=1 Tax=Corchorus olitorius TaxID=93759 RepID=A0A1R3IUE2_9ROSI|nr:hypothetical protein COLO4_21278 [Corchorus olitorius]
MAKVKNLTDLFGKNSPKDIRCKTQKGHASFHMDIP